MPLLDVQRSLRQLGKVRMGAKKRTANGKEYPSKLAKWRLTSPAYELLEAVASVYGGEVSVWQGAPTEGEQYECYTDTDRLRVIVPPGDNSLQQWHETWSAGGCTKRCDGVTEQLSNTPCSCPADVAQRAELAAKGKACKMTTRLKIILPDIPDIGVWMLESHGYYAAVELAGTEELLQMAAARGTMIPAQLRIDQRTAKRNGETRRYAVPVLELVSITTNMLMTGEVTPGLSSGDLQALPAASAPALPSGPRVAPRLDRPESRVVDGGGPPLPPLPHEEGGVSVVGASSRGPGSETTDHPPVNRVAIAAREAGLDDDGRHDLAEWASDGRVRSSALLTDVEVGHALIAAGRVKDGSAKLVRGADSVILLKDCRYGWPITRSGVPDDPHMTMPLDELRTDLRGRIEQLGDDGKKAWKDAGLPALTKLADEHRERALRCVASLEPF